MAEEFKGTSIEKGKGNSEFSEVEELIRQTLEESKKITPAAATDSTPVKKEEYKATAFTPPPPPPSPPPVQPKEKPKAAAPASGYDATFKEYKTGDIVKGTVIKVDPSGILVDIKYKADGLIPPEELSDKSSGSPEEAVKVGDSFDVLIENLENKEGYVVLSKRKAAHEKKWKFAMDAYHDKTLLEGKIIQALQGGLVVDCSGIRGFVPASQVSKDSDVSVGKVLPLKIIDVNRRQGKLVLSNRLGAGEKGKANAGKLFEELEVGQVRRGKVAGLKSFGAFVDLGGIEGLIHLSELSWKRVKHPSEVLKAGEEIDVFVLGVDQVNKKISLGLKELQPDPWVNAAELYKPGQVVKAKILRFAKFGAFVELEHGLEGLIHISELSKEPVQRPEDATKIGDTVDVKILRVIPEEQKIGLSIREVLLDKERHAAPATEEKKVTIGDMIAEKERARAEKEEEETTEEEATEEST